MLFLSTLAEFKYRQTPSGTRNTAASASNIDPLREKLNGDPGKKEDERSPTTRSEGCSRICWREVTGDRLARSFCISLLVEGAAAGAAAGDGCGAGVAFVGAAEELLGLDDDLPLLELFCFSSFSSGGVGSTSL